MTIERQDIQWATEWTQSPEINISVQQLDSFIRSVGNAQLISVIDQEVSLDGATDVEFIPKGSIYLDGYLAGTASSLTVGDSNDVDGLLEAVSPSGIMRFDGTYISSKTTVSQDDTVIVTATSSETVRVVVFYYLPRL